MNRSVKAALVVVPCLAVLAAILIGSAASARRSAVWWTDGASIRVWAERAPLRHVLWTPAVPVRSEGSGDVDEYEPRFSADGTVMVFVRRRAGTNADLFTSRWTVSGWTDAEAIGEVNSEHDELGPELSRDGRSLYFYSDRPGGLGGYDLWVSRAGEAGWGTAVNLGAAVNTAANEYGPALTPDGSTLYFSSNRARTGEAAPPREAWSATLREERGRHDYDVYASDMTGAEPAQAAIVAALSTAADEGAPAVSPVGDYLYFSSDRAGGKGGFDIYRARLSKGSIGTPEGVGEAVNTPANELDAGLSTDGFRLYFSSDRPGPDGEARATEARQRYSLWFTASREVVEEYEARGSRYAGVWDQVWPWLLLLVLMLAPVLLLLRLVRSGAWQRRMGQLSLLARCLLVSLLIHFAVGSVLAVWRVGSGIVEAIRRGGGTQVVLTSSGAVSDVVAQVRGLGLEAGSPPPLLDLVVAGMPTAVVDTRPVEAPLPVSERAVEPPVKIAAAERSAPATGVPMARAIPSEVGSMHEAAIKTSGPDARRDEATGEEVWASMGEAAVDALEDAAPRTAVVPPRAEASVEQTGLPAAALRLERAARATEVPGTAAVPKAAEGFDTPAVPRAGERVRREREASVDVAVDGGLTGVAAPAGSTPAPTQDLRIAVRGSVRTEEARLGPMAGATERVLPVVREPAHLPPVAMESVGAGVNLPALNRGVQHGGGEKIETSAASTLPSLVAGLSGVTGEADGLRHRVTLQPGAGSDSQREDSIGLEVLPAGDFTPRVLEPAPVPVIGRVPERPGLDTGGARLPGLPAEVPQPLETFAQRAPEVREQVLEKMGGNAETERAVSLALAWFARHQEADGRWTGRHFDDRCRECTGAAEFDADAAMTGMALLCYLGAGHTHRAEGPYRDTVERALSWLVRREGADGDLRRGETMYGQTVAAVAMCEALAMTKDAALADPAKRAVGFVLATATARDRRASDQDTSVLGWLVMTVESARRAGIDVPRDVFDAAGRWLDHVGTPGTPGRYAYRRGESASAAMTAEAMFVRQLLGRARTEPMMEQSARFVLNEPPRWSNNAPTYYWYYATLALFEHQGEAWKRWNEALVPELVAHQRSDGAAAGSWDPQDPWSRMGGRIYQTAVCTLSLEVYYRYRPK